MLFFGFRALAWMFEIVLGIGLIFNCSRGLLTREGMYDSESTNMMFVSQLVGLAVGLGLLALALGLVHVPLLWGLPTVGVPGGG